MQDISIPKWRSTLTWCESSTCIFFRAPGEENSQTLIKEPNSGGRDQESRLRVESMNCSIHKIGKGKKGIAGSAKLAGN